MLPLWDQRVSLYVLAGPALGFSTKCGVNWLAISGPNSRQGIEYGQCEIPAGSGAHIQLDEGADFGAIGGLGAEVEFLDWRWSAEVVHTIGFRSGGAGRDAVRNRVRTVQFGVSVPFR